MALHNLTVTVVDGGKAGAGIFEKGNSHDVAGEKTPDGRNSLLYKALNFNSTIKKKFKQSTSPTVYFAATQAVSLIQQVGSEVVNYYVGNIGRANGDSNYQAIVGRRIEVVTDALSLGQGALGGAAAGAIAGPIGAAIGAVVGLASSAISVGFKYAERERKYQHEMFKENTSQAYQLARADYSALNGRLR